MASNKIKISTDDMSSKTHCQKIIKETLISSLTTNLNDCKYEFSKESRKLAPLEFCGASSSLCSTIEAIFLHGLKCDSLKAYFSDSDQRRESSFWRFVITFLHKQEIKSIQSLEHVKTNIGYSRVFVRKSLNDSTIFCYFTNITPASCKKYYHDYAFVNDEDLLRKVRKLLIDFDVAFQLPLNSSLLNTYDDGPLILLGIPTSTKRQEVVSIGEDIADGIESSTWYDPSIDDVKESLKFSISVDDDEQFLTTLVIAEYNNTNEQEDEVTENESSTGESESQNNNESGGKSANFDSPKIQLQDDLDDLSFKDLLDEKPDRISLNIAKIRTNISENVKMNCNTNEIQFLESTGNAKGNRIFQDFQNMVEDLCKLNNQCGLKAQDFLCNGCKMLLGVTISLISVCHFDGHYYCRSCMTIEKFQIPAKIIYNWDFKKYAVSKKAAEFLEDQKSQPLIDLELLYPSIYNYIEPLNRLLKLRNKLNFIRDYIFTCSESAIIHLQKLLYGREYIYEAIHLYSIADLSLIQSGEFEETLKKVVTLELEHCLKCPRCNAKSFICEYCKNGKFIYSFDVDETHRCLHCGAVSHLNCYQPLIPCPKCERKKKL